MMRIVYAIAVMVALVGVLQPGRLEAKESYQACYAKCMANYACGPGFPRGKDDMGCQAYGGECRRICRSRK